jgi:hypothetical protein
MCQRLICSPVVVVVALGVEEGLVPMPQLAGSCNAQSGVAASGHCCNVCWTYASSRSMGLQAARRRWGMHRSRCSTVVVLVLVSKGVLMQCSVSSVPGLTGLPIAPEYTFVST